MPAARVRRGRPRRGAVQGGRRPGLEDGRRRPAARFATRARVPSADELLVEWPDEVIEQEQPDEATAAVVLTHEDSSTSRRSSARSEATRSTSARSEPGGTRSAAGPGCSRKACPRRRSTRSRARRASTSAPRRLPRPPSRSCRDPRGPPAAPEAVSGTVKAASTPNPAKIAPWRRSSACSTTTRPTGTRPRTPGTGFEDRQLLRRFLDADSEAIDFTPGELLGSVSGELGLRSFLEGARYQLTVTSDKDGPDSVFEREPPEAEIVISQPFWPAYLTAERIAKAPNLKLAVTAGIGPTTWTCRRQSTAG